jgi:hypothetical protein
MTAIDRAREAQNKIKRLATEVKTAISNLTRRPGPEPGRGNGGPDPPGTALGLRPGCPC